MLVPFLRPLSYIGRMVGRMLSRMVNTLYYTTMPRYSRIRAIVKRSRSLSSHGRVLPMPTLSNNMTLSTIVFHSDDDVYCYASR